MGKVDTLKLFTSNLAVFVYFFFLGAVSLILIQQITLTAIMQVLAVYLLLIFASGKFILSKTQKNARNLVYLLGLLPVILLIDFLVFSTGGLSSSFLIITHFFALGLAFLLSPQIAVAFIFSTVILIFLNFGIDPSSAEFASKTPFVAFLYFIAYIALIPFSYILAREYKVKEEWVNILEKQIATSKTQEEELLKNITDAVIVIDVNFNIVYLNKAAGKISKYGKEVLSQNIFKFFTFKDENGRNLAPYSLPFEQTLSSKTQSLVQNIQISAKDKLFTKIDLKILPAIGPEGPLGLILIAEDKLTKEKIQKREENITSLALTNFTGLLTKQKQAIFALAKSAPTLPLRILIRQNEELERLAEDFIYAQKLESGGIGALSSIVDVAKIIEEIIARERITANELGLLIIPQGQIKKQKLIQPKQFVKFKTDNRIFERIFVIGNASWIHDSFERIFKLIYALAKRTGEIKISIIRENNLGIIKITFPTKTKINPDLIFTQFYAKAMIPYLLETTGLEGFIAKELIERMGGKIIIEAAENPQSLTFTVTFGTKEEKEQDQQEKTSANNQAAA